MTYGKFAYLYDKLMSDVPYDKWLELILQAKQDFGLTGNHLLDLACGTGELSIRLAEAGFQVTGVDLSEDMLSVAQGKTVDSGQTIFYLEQDMSSLEGLPLFDIIGIFCDSLNYLESEEAVLATFASVYQHLDENGLFIFDVHSLYKMNSLFINQTYALNDEDLSLIWQCYDGEYPNSVEHELTFFALGHDGKYNRYDELHFQRTFSVDQYKTWLAKSGFTVIKVAADFQEGEINAEAERIFFFCKKAD
ncbi:class I SAM-dependent DNA methyltransferase [Niallia sp. 01092]|uniref:class I SAM-dependent DNA methyltransferase n=1 Tax=unclassified Niallia TaxID=2837522 RepID=UPI003FD4997E